MQEHDNHLVVHNKNQLRAAILAGAYPTFEEARINPFSIRLEGTRFEINFNNGLHERDAQRILRSFTKVPSLHFRSTESNS